MLLVFVCQARLNGTHCMLKGMKYHTPGHGCEKSSYLLLFVQYDTNGMSKREQQRRSQKSKIVVMLMARVTLARMAVQLAVARSSDKWGTITVYNAFVIVKGI